MITRKSMLELGSALLLSMLIAGCGSDNNANQTDITGANNTAEPLVAPDTFLAAVTAAVATTSDTADPASIDSTTITGPDNTAPGPIS